MKRIAMVSVLILLALIAGPACAATINTTVLYLGGQYIYKEYNDVTIAAHSVTPGNGIIENIVSIPGENIPVYTTISRSGGVNPISITITYVPTNLLSGTKNVNINGQVRSYSYSRPLAAVAFLTDNEKMYIEYCADASKQWYLVVLPREYVIDNLNILDPTGPLMKLYNDGAFGYIHIDTETYSYIPVGSPVAEPYDFGITTSSDTIDVIYTEANSAAIALAVAKTEAHQEEGGDDPLTLISNVFKMISQAASTLQKLGELIVGLYGAVYSVANWVFAATIFAGLNALYIGIAIMLAIEESDDVFQAFGKFQRRMMKLFRFYMELFKALKEIIKWW